MTYAVIFSNPFEGFSNDYVPVLEGETVNEFLSRTGYDSEITKRPCLIEMDGKELLERDFDNPIGEQTLSIKPLVQDPATIIFGILAIAAVSKIIYDKLNKELDPTERGADDSPSLSSRNNRARIGEAKPYLIGKMRVFPDLAAKSYTEYNHDNTTDLYQLFEVTLGEAEIDTSTARYEETELSAFSSPDIEVLPPNTLSTLFPSEVYIGGEISRLEINDGVSSEYVVVPSGEKATKLAFDFTMLLYRTTSEGKLRSRSLTIKVQIHEIDDAGVEIGAWQDVVFSTNQTAAAHGSPTADELLLKFINGTTREKRQTEFVNVPAGRYKVRVERITPVNNDTKITDDLYLYQVKSFLQDTTLNPDSTQIAVRLRSSESVGNRSLSKFSVIASRKMPVLTNVAGLAWTQPQETSSPAMAMADILRSNWGGQRIDSAIDLQGLYDLSVKHAAQGLECNGIFDSVTDVWKALQAVGGTSFTDPVRFGGKVGAVLDEENVAPSFFFNMRNIVRGSFAIEYQGRVDETPDYVVVKYLDANEDFRELAIECALAGSAKNRKKEVFLWGVTDRDQAFKIGMYQAAKIQYRRKLVTFDVMQEGQVPFYGNLVRISHYMIGAEGSEQVSGDVLSHAGNLLTVSTRPEGYVSPYIIITNQYGEPLGPYTCNIDGNEITITEVFEATGLLFDDDHELPRFSVGEGAEFTYDVKVTNIEPAGDGRVTISGFVENTLVYDAADGLTPPIVGDLPAPVSFAPQITLNSFVGGSIDDPIVYLEFPSDNADSYIVQQKIDGVWQTIARVDDPFIELPVDPDIYEFRVAGENILIGAYEEVTIDATLGPDIGNTVPADVTGLTFSDGKLFWSLPVIPIDFRGFVVRSNSGNNPNWATSSPLHEGIVTQAFFPLLETVEETTTFLVKAIDSSGFVSENAASVVITTAAAYPFDAITNLSLFEGGLEFSGTDVIFKWDHDNGVHDWFNYYEVEIYSGATLLRTEETTSPFYVYNYGKNYSDHLAKTATQGAYYAIEIRVTPISRHFDNAAQLIRGGTVTLSVTATFTVSASNIRFYTHRDDLEQSIQTAGETADWPYIANLPANIAGLTGAEVLDNSLITPEDVGAESEAGAQAKADQAEANAKAYADASFVLTTTHTLAIADLQSQIDGNITSWFYSGVPTLANAPASTWANDTERDNHLGDLYYDNDTGYAYRFRKVASVYSWQQLSDSDISAALAVASAAQDTADSKRRVFITTPSGPYDAGDLWDDGSLIRRSTVTRGSGYVAGDWVGVANYVTNTNQLIDGANLGNTADWTGLVGVPSRLSDSATTGLNLTATHMGYYNGSWQSYMNNQGHFYLNGDADNYLAWNGTTLTVKGTIQAKDIITFGGSGQRIEILSSDNQFHAYWDDGNGLREMITLGNATEGGNKWAMTIGDNIYIDNGISIRSADTEGVIGISAACWKSIVGIGTGYGVVGKSWEGTAFHADGALSLFNNFSGSIDVAIPKLDTVLGSGDAGKIVKLTGHAAQNILQAYNTTNFSGIGTISDQGPVDINPTIGVIADVQEFPASRWDAPDNFAYGFSDATYATFRNDYYLARVVVDGVARVLIDTQSGFTTTRGAQIFCNGQNKLGTCRQGGTGYPARSMGKVIEAVTLPANDESLVWCYVSFGA